MIKQFLSLKFTQSTYGYIQHGLSVDFVKLGEPLYNNFYLTPLGIFRFGNPKTFHKTTMLFSPNLVLPKRGLQKNQEVKGN